MNNRYIDPLIKDNIYAHFIENRKERLSEHLERTIYYYYQMEKKKNLKSIILNIIKKLSDKKISDSLLEEVYSYFKMAIYYHDIGKINPRFQKEIMENDIGTCIEGLNTEHSIVSASIYFDACIKEIYDDVEIKKINKEESTFLICLVYYFSYIISRHHGKLDNFKEYGLKLSNLNINQIYQCTIHIEENNMNNMLKSFHEYYNIDGVSLYILTELLYSCMVTADFFATTEFMTEKRFELKKEKNSKLFSKYEKSSLYNKIRDYQIGLKEESGINKIRNDIFIESESTLKAHLDKNIFYLEAPTGSGKTNMAINLSRLLYEETKEIDSINYIFPFNTLIDQTKDTLTNYFEEYKDFVMINSCSASVDESKEILDYQEAYIKSEFRQYDIKLTSHVNFFDTLFGVSKSNKYNLYDFVNSVVVLDEIQSYSNSIWMEMIILLEKYAKLLNIKLVIMSATLPKLTNLIDSDIADICELINDAKEYYNNLLFKNRVSIDYSLLKNEKLDQETLVKNILKYKDKKVLVEFITKETANNMYKRLKEEEEVNVYELTGDDNEFSRKNIIEKTKILDKMILISTQTIEAGVDIDMDIGFKDISFVDNEEQFLGRINRSSKKKNCKVYFFDFDDERMIYRNDFRNGLTLRSLEIRDILKNKNFTDYYKKIMNKIYNSKNKYNLNNIQNLYKSCMNLDYLWVCEKLKLIKENTSQLFLNYNIKYDGNLICGKDIWREFKDLCCNFDISYAEKQIKLSIIKPKLNQFIYSIYNCKSKNITKFYDEEFAGIYYVENGSEFITEDGKFDRQKYTTYTGGIFL